MTKRTVPKTMAAVPGVLVLTTIAESDLRDARLTSLRRLVRIQRDHSAELNTGGEQLLARSIFATYADCIEGGYRAEADALLKDIHTPVLRSPRARLGSVEIVGATK